MSARGRLPFRFTRIHKIRIREDCFIKREFHDYYAMESDCFQEIGTGCMIFPAIDADAPGRASF